MTKKPDATATQQAKTRDSEIYEQVFDAMLEQKLAPGTRLSEDKLGQVFGVSRTIIRKVLQRLAYEGVVDMHHNRGASVAQTSQAQVREAFTARRSVELAVVEQACKHINAEQLEHLTQILDAEQAAIQANDHGRAIRLSGEWHLVMASYCGNEFLESFSRSLISRCSLIIAQYEVLDSKLCPGDDHHAILDAIRQRDIPLAQQLMAEHIAHIEAKIRLDTPEDNSLSSIFNHGKSA